jgi:replicative DNA helicase
MIKKFKDIEKNIAKMRENGIQRGNDTGFKSLDKLYSIKPGTSTVILGPPHHGKSEFCFELLFNQAEKFGKRSIIYSPETGSVEDIYAEFIHKYTGKGIYRSSAFCCEDIEFYKAADWIDHHFEIIDSDEKAYSLTELYEDCKRFKKDGNPIDIILADPYNELSHDMSKFGTRQDLYIEEMMGEMRRYLKKAQEHLMLTIHPSYQQLIVDKDTGIKYYPMPMAREAAGGQALFRKAMTWINIWRPAAGLRDHDGNPFQDNEVQVIIEKAKPKGVATKGECRLFFDWHRNRYYEFYNADKCYAFEHENYKAKSQSGIKPNSKDAKKQAL